jgi:hypothetical protein
MTKSKRDSVGRRRFLKGAATGAAALAAAPAMKAQAQGQPARPAALPPSPAQRAAETSPPSIEDIQIVERPGSDYMVDVFNSLGLE